jgi:hypothetical protein
MFGVALLKPSIQKAHHSASMFFLLVSNLPQKKDSRKMHVRCSSSLVLYSKNWQGTDSMICLSLSNDRYTLRTCATKIHLTTVYGLSFSNMHYVCLCASKIRLRQSQ